MKLFQKIGAWQQTTPGLITFIVVGAGLAYVFGSLAVDTGSLLDYALTLLLTVMAIQNLVILIGRTMKGKGRG